MVIRVEHLPVEKVIKQGELKQIGFEEAENIIVECRNKLSKIIHEFRHLAGQSQEKPNWYNQVCVASGALDVAYHKLRKVER